MPSNRKRSKSKQTKSKLLTAKPANKKRPRKQAVKSRPSKKATRKTRARKKTASKTRVGRRQKTVRNVQQLDSSSASQRELSGVQSGDLEGLSRAEQADSESVNELVEEGNIFEAGAVSGVEEADNAEEREVKTHQVPEDDVPDEYLDRDE